MTKASDLTEEFLEAFLHLYRTDTLKKFETVYPGISNAVCDLVNKRKDEEWERKKKKNAQEHDDLVRRWSRYSASIKKTAIKRRESLSSFYSTHRGKYHRLMYLKEGRAKSERFKHSRWTMFTASCIQYRMQCVKSWLPDAEYEAEGVAQQMWQQPLDDPYTNIRWPWGSACRINPQHTQEWLDAQKQKAEVFRIEGTEAKMRRILNKLMDKSNDDN